MSPPPIDDFLPFKDDYEDDLGDFPGLWGDDWLYQETAADFEFLVLGHKFFLGAALVGASQHCRFCSGVNRPRRKSLILFSDCSPSAQRQDGADSAMFGDRSLVGLGLVAFEAWRNIIIGG
jgi:hypothetical protein